MECSSRQYGVCSLPTNFHTYAQMLAHSSNTTHVTFPLIFVTATGSPIKPVLASRDRIATLPLSWLPTATRVPDRCIVNCRGKSPPLGHICTNSREPSWCNEKVVRESDGMVVLFFGSGLGSENSVLLRLLMIKKRLSG